MGSCDQSCVIKRLLYREWMGRDKSRPRKTRLEATIRGQTKEDDGLGHDIGHGIGEVDRSEKYLGS